MKSHLTGPCLAVAALLPVVARADAPRILDRDTVIELARARAPAVQVARSVVAETRGSLVEARVFAENPTVEGSVGPRWATERTIDAEVALAVPLPLGRQRGRRIAVAERELERDAHLAADIQRQTCGAALVAYYRVLHAMRRLELAERRRELAEELVTTTAERERAGDVAAFEVRLAEGELVRAESDTAAERQQLARARTELAVVLGLASMTGVVVAGALTDHSLWARLPAPGASSGSRADVKALAAQRAVAGAAVALADAQRLPALSLRLIYAQEEHADALLGGVSVTLPIFQRGQAERVRSRARSERARVELDSRRAAVFVEIEGARTAYAAALEAAAILERRGVPQADAGEGMARDSYGAGKIDLAAFLLIRRDGLEIRREYVDRALGAALAGVDLWVATGAGQ
jgi:cobalt-zinc-cadmium efflux system outer membrane protein